MKKLFNPYLLLVALLALLAILQPATTYAAPAARPLFAPTTPVIPGLTLTKVGNGTVTVTPNQSTFDYGQTVTINAVPDSGWKLAGFSGDTAPAFPGGTRPGIFARRSRSAHRASSVPTSRPKWRLTSPRSLPMPGRVVRWI